MKLIKLELKQSGFAFNTDGITTQEELEKGNGEMRIKQINSQSRRDFHADYECPHCGFIELNRSGYDDANFHNNVIPTIKCKSCGESEVSLKSNYRPLATKYPDGYQV